ncbi:Isochorismatase hydrolase [Backusella circina FSU 941]|nr:Isochorismatase hydrolase [Backusella circina FSU 941]
MKEALIIVDVQNDYFPNGKFPTWQPEETAEQIKILINKFRNENKEVIYVIHHSTDEQRKTLDFFEPGSWGAEIHDSVKPLPSEKVFIKEYSDSFVGTDLTEYLKSKSIDTTIVVGMMIHNCVNATAYSSTDLGFKTIVVDEAVNTMDLKYNENEVIPAEVLKKSFLAGIQFAYAKLRTMAQILDTDY